MTEPWFLIGPVQRSDSVRPMRRELSTCSDALMLSRVSRAHHDVHSATYISRRLLATGSPRVAKLRCIGPVLYFACGSSEGRIWAKEKIEGAWVGLLSKVAGRGVVDPESGVPMLNKLSELRHHVDSKAYVVRVRSAMYFFV